MMRALAPIHLLGLWGGAGHDVLWRWRFHSFGWQSRVGRCDVQASPNGDFDRSQRSDPQGRKVGSKLRTADGS